MTPPIIIPAETLQAEDTPAPRARRSILLWALWATAIALTAAHPIWVSRGMPVPSFLTPVLEILHV